MGISRYIEQALPPPKQVRHESIIAFRIQLAKENKKFQISKVASGARFRDYRGCIEWLLDAGIVQACYCLNYPELPLKGKQGMQCSDTAYQYDRVIRLMQRRNLFLLF